MSYIYAIQNDINDKVYIGKTNLTIEQRFAIHCRDSKKDSEQIRPLYRAMAKYGEEHFSIRIIEECSTQDACSREKHWIKYFNSFENGYNATEGGDGKQLFDHERIAETLRKEKYLKVTAEKIGCSIYTVRIVAKEFNIPFRNTWEDLAVPVMQCSKKDGVPLRSFDSYSNAARWLINEGLSNSEVSKIVQKISLTVRGKRKSAYGYYWKPVIN